MDIIHQMNCHHVNVVGRHALHQVTFPYDLEHTADRDDERQMLILMLNSEGHMPWQEENPRMKNISPTETDQEIRVGQSLIIKNHQVPHKTLQQCQVMLPERSQGLSRLLTAHWRRN